MSDPRASLDELRRSFAAPERAETPVGQCPDPERIWQAVHARLAPGEAREVVEHVAACPSCAADWRVAMRSEESRAAALSALPRRARFRFGAPKSALGWTGLAAAAALFLAALTVGLYRTGGLAPGAPVYRTPGEEILRSLIAEDEVLPRDRALLRWTPVGEGAVYSVEVCREDLTSVASAHDLSQAEFLVPRESLERVPRGALIAWQVEARLPDGRRIASPAFLSRVE